MNNTITTSISKLPESIVVDFDDACLSRLNWQNGLVGIIRKSFCGKFILYTTNGTSRRFVKMFADLDHARRYHAACAR